MREKGASLGMEPSYADFRRRLDDVLGRRDPRALRDFLIAEGEWEPDTTTDPERALWMMIATSPALAALHDEATQWLTDHGYDEEARLLRGGASRQSGRSRDATGGSHRPGASKPGRRDAHRDPHAPRTRR